MATHLAAYGMVGRLGGEEFALIAPEASAEQVVGGLSELLRTVEATPIIASSVTVHVTLSAGVAVRKVSEPFDKVYSEADAALYRATKAGRNCIELAEPTRLGRPVPGLPDRPSFGTGRGSKLTQGRGEQI